MHGRKKNPARRSGEGKGKALMEQMGIFPDEMMGAGLVIDDDDLEAELLALQGGSKPPKSKEKLPQKINLSELDKMVAASMKDIPSDEELSDVEDPELMAELMELGAEGPSPSPASSPVTQTTSAGSTSDSQRIMTLLKDRLDMYTTAEMNAKSQLDNGKARRMNRGVKTIQDLLKKVEFGQQINDDDIPPPVATGGSKPVSQTTTPENEQPPVKSSAYEPTPVLWSPGQQVHPVPSMKPVLPPTQQPVLPTTGVQPMATEPVSGGFLLNESGILTSDIPQYNPYTGSVPYQAPVADPVTIAHPYGQFVPPTSPSSDAPLPASEPSPSQVVSGQTDTGLSKADAEKRDMMVTRRDQYKAAALRAKRSDDNATAMKYIKTAKQFDQVIAALERGEPVDLSGMPPPPVTGLPSPSKTGAKPVSQNTMAQTEVESSAKPAVQPRERSAMQASAGSTPAEGTTPDEIEVPELNIQEKKKLFNAPETANSTEEALQQRLEKYKSSQKEAQDQGNSSKARRMGRIIKQYEEAVKAHKAGKPVNYDDLPCPPGFPPIPQPAVKPSAAKPAATNSEAPRKPDPSVPAPKHAVQPTSQTHKVQRQLSTMSRAEQQTIFLQERQLEFRKAALKAKTNGDIELAKKYLRLAKGFDVMIEASTAGLPVDMTQIPPPPHSRKDEDFEFVEPAEITGDREEMYKKLEQELIQQIQTCAANADSFTHLGDVSSATKFDKMGQNCRKDLDALRNAYKHGDPVPRFHYENRQFSMVKCCTDLGDTDLEIVIVRGISYCLPSGYQAKDLDTYVKYEFPFPTDDPQCGQTDTQKHTTSPEYNQSFKLQINRKSRVFQRLLKTSKTLKLDVYYKRGFLKGDKLLGSVNFKLQALENNCEVHDSADLMDGRKACGGKLEFKVRIRDPFGSKQVEEVKEKWVVIDHFEQNIKPQAKPQIRQKVVSSRPAPSQHSQPPNPYKDSTSMEVLKFEKHQLETQIRRYQGRLTKAEEEALFHKSQLITRKIEDIKRKLQAGGSAAWKAYADTIEKTQNSYVQEAKVLTLQGNKDKAVTAMQKKKLIEREVEAIRSKLRASNR